MRREKRQAEEINRKERRKGQPLGSTKKRASTDPKPTVDHVGKEQRGRGKSGAINPRRIVRTFSSRKETAIISLRPPRLLFYKQSI